MSTLAESSPSAPVKIKQAYLVICRSHHKDLVLKWWQLFDTLEEAKAYQKEYKETKDGILDDRFAVIVPISDGIMNLDQGGAHDLVN